MLARLRTRILAWRRFRRRFVAAGIGAVGAVCLLALCAYWMTRAVPPWWRQPRANDAQTAEAVENGVINQLSTVRARDPSFTPTPDQTWQSEAWSVSLLASDANAWLNARLPQWLANREPPVKWPGEIREVQVEFEQGVVKLGTRISHAGRDQIVAVSLRPVLDEHGALWMTADGLQVGALPVPPSWVLEWVRDARHELFPDAVSDLPETQAMLDAFAGKRPMVADAVVRLDSGRRVRLLNLAPKKERLDLTFRTEKR